MSWSPGDSTLNIFNSTLYRNEAESSNLSNGGNIFAYTGNSSSDVVNVNIYNSIVMYAIMNGSYYLDVNSLSETKTEWNFGKFLCS